MTPFAQQVLAWIIIILVVALALMLMRRLWKLIRDKTSRTSQPARTMRPTVVENLNPVKSSLTASPVHEEIKSPPPAEHIETVAAPAMMPATAIPEKTARVERLDPEVLPFSDTRDYSFGAMTPLLASLLPETEQRRIQTKRELLNAGYFTPHAYQNLAAARYLGIILPIIFFGVLLVVVPSALEPLMIAGLVVGPILGWSIPAMLVRSQAAERLREIENGMPDMLDLLNMCVSQGMTITPALSRVGKELENVYPALSQELKIVAEQGRINNLEQALTNFSERVDVPQVHSFTSLLIQTERLGTSVSKALTDYSDNMRESLRQRADQKANSAAFKLLFPTVLCLMPAVFLFLMGPAVVQLSDFFNEGGRELLEGGGAAQIEQYQPIEPN